MSQFNEVVRILPTTVVCERLESGQDEEEDDSIETFLFSGADHHPLHRVPRPHLQQLLRVPGGKGRRGCRW